MKRNDSEIKYNMIDVKPDTARATCVYRYKLPSSMDKSQRASDQARGARYFVT